ncbi:MAG: branched-chain amino acid transport system substrate-binding protein [Micromonosporaceae bacterium]|jgi:ABC-type branched-subunit amino acid transport system substrate-binding protein|nr:branched-chain amino acid transport system substrate-binding protein [Micromonosporaceae bacterium]
MRVTRPVSALTAVTVVLLATGCSASPSNPRPIVADGQIRLYGSDGVMSNSFGDALKGDPGVLAGMKGTAPLTPLTEDFKRRVKQVDPAVIDFNYAGEAYDAVIVAALAAEAAHSTDAGALAKYIVAVTVGGSVCDSFKACAQQLHSTGIIRYQGVSSLRRSGFTDSGEPSTASYGTLNFGRDNHIDDAKTEFVGAGDAAGQARNPPPAVTVTGRTATPPPLKMGGLLPHTGELAGVGPPIFAGARLGVQEINDAGGVLGRPVEWLDGDDGTSPVTAAATVDRFIAAGVQVMIGAAASGISAAVLPKAVAAGRVMISPSATSDSLSTLDDKGLFFRTSPPDKLQARALADILMRDGTAKVVIVARDDEYGIGLQRGVKADLTAAGIAAANIRLVPYPGKATYDPGEQNTLFKPLATEIKRYRADAILIVGFAESAMLIRALREVGVTFKS